MPPPLQNKTIVELEKQYKLLLQERDILEEKLRENAIVRRELYDRIRVEKYQHFKKKWT